MIERRRSLLPSINRPNFSNSDCPNNGDGVTCQKTTTSDCLNSGGAYDGDLASAEKYWLLLLDSEVSRRGTENTRTKKVLRRVVEFYEAWGKPGQAEKYRELL